MHNNLLDDLQDELRVVHSGRVHTWFLQLLTTKKSSREADAVGFSKSQSIDFLSEVKGLLHGASMENRHNGRSVPMPSNNVGSEHLASRMSFGKNVTLAKHACTGINPFGYTPLALSQDFFQGDGESSYLKSTFTLECAIGRTYSQHDF